MEPWKKVKTTTTFKRNVKINFNKLVNMNPLAYRNLLESKSNESSSEPCSSQELSEQACSASNTPQVFTESTLPISSEHLPVPEASERWDITADENEYSEPEPEDETFSNMRLLVDLQSWAVKNNIRQSALKELLLILNNRLSDVLPRDPRTLLKTVQSVELIQMENGQYWHQGAISCLERVFSEISEPLSISLRINIDGLPVYKSSKDEFWPILMNIEEFPMVQPMIIGIYGGKQKPANITSFLTPFVDEMEMLCRDGVVINGQKLSVTISCFVCDSPARAFIKGTAYFNSQHGCQQCTITGEYSYVSRTNYFPRVGCPPRTDADFREKKYGSHHKNDSPLLRLNIDIIKGFPIGDSLHLIDLGIVKKLLLGWRDGKFGNFNTKWPAIVTASLSKRLLQLRMPREIHRAIRGLDCMGHWKGVEFRTFLHYVSIVVLQPILPPDIYEHFLAFFCAVTICSSENHNHLLNLAHALLLHFIDYFKDFYGQDYISSNVHNLSHLVADVERFGILSKSSAYPFENKLFQIKNLIRSGRNPLSQIAKRLSEMNQISKNVDLSKERANMAPVLKKELIDFDFNENAPFFDNETRAYGQIELEDFSLSSDLINQWFLTKTNEVVAMNIVFKNGKGELQIKGNCLNKLDPFFITPIRSNVLHIYRSLRSATYTKYYSLCDIKCKMVAIPINDTTDTVFIPLLHTLVH